MDDCQQIAHEIRSGNRRALARAITMVESTRAEHQLSAKKLIDILSNGDVRQSLRVALTGAPGVGKSTLINALGLRLTKQGTKVAVLAVDPSSTRTGGSILGDKTRMERLSREPLSYIRPTPSSNILGGVAKHTREVIFLCEQAGFDCILVETTGVGQSETMVGQLTDIFVLLVAPAAGDELQGVKRGIMELADIVAVTKADGDLQHIADRTCVEYQSALRLFTRRDKDPEDFPLAATITAYDSDQISKLWGAVTRLRDWRKANGIWEKIRTQQELSWVISLLREEIVHSVETQTDVIQTNQRLANVITATGTAFSPEVRRELHAAFQSLVPHTQNRG